MTYQEPVVRVDGVTRSFGEERPTHWYEDAEGRRIPGVTTILSGGIPKPGLVGWAMRATAEYAVNNWTDLDALPLTDRLNTLKGAARNNRDEAANRGTEVHHYAEQVLHGEEVDPPEAIRAHIESYVSWLDLWRPDVVLSEVVVYSLRYGYAGTLDMVIDVPGHGRVLADIKTNRTGIYPETALQLAAYRYADRYLDPKTGEAFDMPEVDAVWALWVRPEGTVVIPLTAGPDELTSFRYAKEVWRWSETAADLVGPAIRKPGTGAVA